MYLSRRLLALPLGLAATAAIGLAPGAAATGGPPGPAAAPGDPLSYVVNSATDAATLDRVESATADAGGTVVATYPEIGVTVAHAADADFGSRLRAVPGVRSAGATRTAPLRSAAAPAEGRFRAYEDRGAAGAAVAGAGSRVRAVPPEPLEAEQWSLRVVRADRAHALSTGSPDVTVGVIDNGVDDTHPDLAAHFSAGQSADCVGGAADTTPGAWRPYPEGDFAGHGTWVAGQIAAPRNGVGVAGVAPDVTIAAIKAAGPGDGFVYAESVVCALVFAADHGVAIANSSFSIDPWHLVCADDPDQRAILDAVSRAQRYATGKGLLQIAAAGNGSRDLADPEFTDAESPSDGTPVERTVDPAACPVLPHMLPGVVSAASVGAENLKSDHSDYGLGVIDIAAPGGDDYQIPETPSRDPYVLSTWPGGEYASGPGTSAASAQVSGVAALLKSAHPGASPAKLRALLAADADNPGCPDRYDPDGDGAENAVCEGDDRRNGFYGAGVADALDAVRR
ncbi:peptidase S8 [Streptomyces sp. WAC 06738]|uniref:S8 family serine peptidase n=1 Tax=Streptomyces sp. WAC 06738 TaxID=2203210 RepID=UPI000F6D7D2D|nr:S8 family serine peptidase [Streptomyces sp. WAC 06738]AZM45234.1 peptidase S8 [Streptomyces sp. WAC 06738]